MDRLVYGAIMQSLAPAIDAPNAKLASLNTPQHRDDYAVKGLKDPMWRSSVYGCWTPETAHLPVDQQISSWAAREPGATENQRKAKKSAIAGDRLSTWLREMEIKLVADGTTKFKQSWLKYYVTPPEGMSIVYAIDPVPAPLPNQLKKGQGDTDFECHVVWGAKGTDRYLLDLHVMRGHEPTWTIKTFFELQHKWRPFRTRLETSVGQLTLYWLVSKAMDQRRQWYTLEPFDSRVSKFNRIVSTLGPIASNGRMYIPEKYSNFVDQFAQYPGVDHDDILDRSAIALMDLEEIMVFADPSAQSHF